MNYDPEDEDVPAEFDDEVEAEEWQRLYPEAFDDDRCTRLRCAAP